MDDWVSFKLFMPPDNIPIRIKDFEDYEYGFKYRFENGILAYFRSDTQTYRSLWGAKIFYNDCSWRPLSSS